MTRTPSTIRFLSALLALAALAACDDEPFDWCPSGQTDCAGTCLDTRLDPSNCGGCGNICKTGEVCTAGVCTMTCVGGTTLCSGKCVDTTLDPANCGTCGTACKTGELCSTGTCSSSCLGGSTLCSNKCVDMTLDPSNCGACGTTCKTGEVCSSSKCGISCVGGTTLCSGKCVDTTLDPANCGGCGTACKTGEVCSSSKCGISCVGGTTLCSSKCVDVNFDPYNCGTCGTTCKSTEVCSTGKCGVSCVGGTTLCSNKCVDTTLDPDNCGACGTVCKTNEVCSASKCGVNCVGGTTLCSKKCVDTDVDPANCGTCGTICKSGEICSNGKCTVTCSGGTTLCSGKCVDITLDPDNCGACGTICKTGEVCTSSKCSFYCPTGQTKCTDSSSNTYCANLTSDISNCGVCGTACKYGEICTASKCEKPCGNGKLDTGEACDGTLLGSKTCQSLGFAQGTLSCKSDCSALDSTKCYWLVGLGGVGVDEGRAIVSDGKGGMLVAGSFTGSVTLGSTSLTAQGGTNDSDLFLTRIDSTGKATWAVSAGSSQFDYVTAITADSSGNAYIVGDFAAVAAFGSTSLTPAGWSDIFVAKVDNTGKFVWAVAGGGSFADWGRAIAVDASGNVYVAGYYTGQATFGTTKLTAKGGSGDRDAFVVKLDSTGKVLWAVSLGGTQWDTASAVTVDSKGVTTVAGEFQGSATFDKTTLTSKGLTDIYVASLDTAGKITSAFAVGGSLTDQAAALSVDSSGNLTLAGTFGSQITLDKTTLTSKGGKDVFVAVFDSKQKVTWAVSAGGTSDDDIHGMTPTGTGGLVVGGQFTGAATLGSISLTAQGGTTDRDAWVAALDSTGLVSWAVSGGGYSDDEARGVAQDSSGYTFVLGDFLLTATFGQGKLTAQGSSDMFLWRLDSSGK